MCNVTVYYDILQRRGAEPHRLAGVLPAQGEDPGDAKHQQGALRAEEGNTHIDNNNDDNNHN